jgi:hypothetical protein
MAGDWIKMEVCTPEKAEVLAVTARMGWDDADLTVGKLFRLWRWFDQHTADGNAVGVTSALLDRIVGVTGFCESLTLVGWLTITEHGISLPNFDRHNGNTAKNRAQTAKRVAKHKGNAKANAEANATGNAHTVTEALPREEKRREDITPTNVGVESATKSRPTRKCPSAFEITSEMDQWAAEKAPLVNIESATEKFRDHTFKTAINDWPGAWRNWLRKEQEFAEQRRPATVRQQASTFRERDAQQAKALWNKVVGASNDVATIIDITPAARIAQ